ncbi:hypothetical protein DYB37_013303 [Aphanomyces astaci]|uniref:DDE Tnp4 domain-containing protein n=1 Tax=Aphanomyces astaci TaxID=112090 RepID=A0A3R6YFR5_APHAT|nr:hypothetical protein DYB35_011158 [Aphanomyces astaci]RHZ12962.1 hypothetical protein DYB37_013303 [Aphanomyces astaci]
MAPSPPPAAACLSQSRQGLTERAISHGVDVLTNLHAARETQRLRYSSVSPDHDQTCDSPSPIFDSFVDSQGPGVVHKLTNFSPTNPETPKPSSTHSGPSSKHCGSWDVVAAVFKEKSPTFSKRVTGFITAIHPYLKAKFIDGFADKWRIPVLDKAGLCFKNYPWTLYAVDVTFQQTNAPAGSFAVKKRFFSKKHGLYGMKVEASVLPNGYAINVTNAAPVWLILQSATTTMHFTKTC